MSGKAGKSLNLITELRIIPNFQKQTQMVEKRESEREMTAATMNQTRFDKGDVCLCWCENLNDRLLY